MTTSPRVRQSNQSLGDTAVDGLLAGTTAGLAMGMYLAAAGLLGGQSWFQIMAQFDPSPEPSPFTGALAHLAVAGVYGVIFAVVWRGLSRVWGRWPLWVAGLLYGVVLFAVAMLLLRLPPQAAPAGWLAGVAPVHLAVSHAVFGLALGWLLGRRLAAAEHP